MGLKGAGWIVLAALVAASGYAALVLAPARPPAPGAETTQWLAASSLAADHDLLFADADRARFRQRFGAEPADVRIEHESQEYVAAPLAARSWAMAARLSPARGPLALNWLLFSLTLLVAAWVLAPALGATAPLWVALLGFGSIAFRSIFALEPELPAAFAVAVALALVWGRRAKREAKPADVYEGEMPGDAFDWRWPLAGLALGVAAVRSPLYLLLALPMGVDLPRVRRGLSVTLFALGLALPAVFVAAVAGLPWQPPTAVFSLPLLGWNALYALLGRSAGVVLWYAPLLVLLAYSRRRGEGGGGRAWLPLAVFAALALELALYPFDWAGERSGGGNLFFLPLYVALWFALDSRAEGMPRFLSAAVLTLALGTLWLHPYWLHPVATQPAANPALSRIAAPLLALPPFETSLRDVPGSLEIRRGSTRLRTTDPSIGKLGDRMTWFGRRVATVVVESDRPLASLRIELGEQAPSTLGIDGGSSGETLFSPTGQVSFDVQLSAPARRHPLWWSHSPASIYFLQLTLPEPPPEPIPFDLGVVRPAAGAAVSQPAAAK